MAINSNQFESIQYRLDEIPERHLHQILVVGRIVVDVEAFVVDANGNGTQKQHANESTVTNEA